MPKVSKSRPREGKQSRREEILNASVRLFAEHGYRATTVEQIMDHLGTTGAAFYYYFKGKQALLETIFDNAMALVENELQQTLMLGLQPDEALERIVAAHATVVARNPSFCAIMFHDVREVAPAFERVVKQREAIYTSAVTEVYRDGVAQGILVDENPELVVNGILGMANSCYRWYRPGKHPSAEEVGEVFGKMALRMISAETGSPQLSGVVS